jgi:hypothetical protein
MNNGKTFEQQWGFPSEIKTQLGAASYDVRPLPEKFRSGRQRWECLFFGKGNELISRRVAMQLISKKTNRPYHVCAREEAAPPRVILRREVTADYTNSFDVLGDELAA